MKKSYLFLLLLLASQYLLAQQSQWKWAKQYGSPDYEDIQDVATDRNGNVYMVGILSQSGGSANTITWGATTLTTGGDEDGFIAKYDSIGTLKWVKQFKNTLDAAATRVATDSIGNVYVAGYFVGTVDFAGISLSSANGSENFGNAFLCKLNPANGSAVWAKKLNTSTNTSTLTHIEALAIDATGNIYTAGHFDSEIKPVTGATISAAGYSDAFVAKWDNSGNIGWIVPFSSANGSEAVIDLAADKMGNLYAAGYFENDIIVNGSTYSNLDHTPFLAQMSTSTGAITWFKYGTTTQSTFASQNNTISAISLDDAGNIYASGYFCRNIKWGNTTLSNSDITNYYSDIFAVKFTNTGNVTWAKKWGGLLDSDFGYDIAVLPSGDFYLAGNYKTPINFGGVTLPAGAGTGYNSGYLAKYSTTATLTWVRSVGDSTNGREAYFSSVATDRFGNVFTGTVVHAGTLDYGNGVTSNNANSGNSDIGLAKLRDKTISVTAIATAEFPTFISVYPNPMENELNIKWDYTGTLTIFNSLGQSLHTQALQVGENPISATTNLPSGIYTLVLQTEKYQGYMKIVKE